MEKIEGYERQESKDSSFDRWKIYTLLSYLSLSSTSCKPKPEESRHEERVSTQKIEAKNASMALYDNFQRKYRSGELNRPSVDSIDFFSPSEFKRVVFYIRTHHLPFLSDEQFNGEPKEKHVTYLEKCRKCGEEVGDILDMLHGQFDVDTIHLEGVTEQNHTDFSRNWKDDTSANETVARLAGKWIDEEYNTGFKIPPDLLKTYRFATPDGVATSKSWAKILPGEQEPENIALMDATAKRVNEAFSQNQKPDPADMRLIFESREDGALKTIKDNAAVTIFGGAHYFTDNVDSHNRNNPEDRIALVTITPQTLKEEGYQIISDEK